MTRNLQELLDRMEVERPLLLREKVHTLLLGEGKDTLEEKKLTRARRIRGQREGYKKVLARVAREGEIPEEHVTLMNMVKAVLDGG